MISPALLNNGGMMNIIYNLRVCKKKNEDNYVDVETTAERFGGVPQSGMVVMFDEELEDIFDDIGPTEDLDIKDFCNEEFIIEDISIMGFDLIICHCYRPMDSEVRNSTEGIDDIRYILEYSQEQERFFMNNGSKEENTFGFETIARNCSNDTCNTFINFIGDNEPKWPTAQLRYMFNGIKNKLGLFKEAEMW